MRKIAGQVVYTWKMSFSFSLACSGIEPDIGVCMVYAGIRATVLSLVVYMPGDKKEVQSLESFRA